MFHSSSVPKGGGAWAPLALPPPCIRPCMALKQGTILTETICVHVRVCVCTVHMHTAEVKQFCLSICLPCLCVCLSVCVSVCQSVCLPACLCVCLPVALNQFVFFFFQQAVKKRLHDLLVVMQQVLITHSKLTALFGLHCKNGRLLQ